MTKTLINSKSITNKIKQKPKPQIRNVTLTISPNLQIFKHKILSGSGFVENK